MVGMSRATYLSTNDFFNLNVACGMLNQAFGHNNYLVGSALHKSDYRDVDIRCILSDEAFDLLFPDAMPRPEQNAKWALVCNSLSKWLSDRTALPVDFQIQRMSEANNEHAGLTRDSLGMPYKSSKA